MNCKYLRNNRIWSDCWWFRLDQLYNNDVFIYFRLLKVKKSQQKQTIDKNANKTKSKTDANKTKSKTGGLSSLRERLGLNNSNT